MQELTDGRSAVLAPGGGYSADGPLLMYAKLAVERRGGHVHPITWEFAEGLDFSERREQVVRQVESAVNEVTAATGAAPVVISKSLGTLAAPLVADRGLAAVWFTPLLTNDPTLAALRRTTGPCLLVGGTADQFWDGQVARSLAADVVEINGADHGMFVPGPLTASAARMEAIGTVDELNAAIGFAAAAVRDADCLADGDPVPGILGSVQEDLLVAGTELMAPSREGPGANLPRLADGDIARLEAAIDDLTGRLPELRNFIAPGGKETAARLHLARAICRRAERRVTALRHDEDVSPEVYVYLNRLGDLLFVLARYANHVAGVPDIIWAPRA